jgi:hypothetical protein
MEQSEEAKIIRSAQHGIMKGRHPYIPEQSVIAGGKIQSLFFLGCCHENNSFSGKVMLYKGS